jgi:gas vesicle protein
MNSGKVLLGVLTGVAAGALLGILFAPDKGSETRKKLSQKGSDYADELKNKFNEFIESVTDQLDTVQEDVEELARKGKAKADQASRS